MARKTERQYSPHALQNMGFWETIIWTGRRGECAICEHTLAKKATDVFKCEDCNAVYYKLDSGLLDYIGRYKCTPTIQKIKEISRENATIVLSR